MTLGSEQASSDHSAAPAAGRSIEIRAGHLVLAPPIPEWARDFTDLTYEWRRLFAELVGTFFLVLVAAGAVVVSAVTNGSVSRNAAVIAPALMVLAVILAIGGVSGAHLNPVVSIAFALRRDFPWSRVPLYVVAQTVGGLLACVFLRGLFGNVAGLGATMPGPHVTDVQALLIEVALTCGLVSTILGTSSGAQNVGTFSAIGVSAYIALAGLWASPISGASMNPVRSFAPDVVSTNFAHLWLYLVGPTIGMLVGVGIATVLRGSRVDPAAARAAQGTLGTLVVHPASSSNEGND